MSSVLKVSMVSVALVLVAAAGVYGWASVTAQGLLDQAHAVHTVDFPVPFPLSPEEVAAAGDVDLDALSRQRAVARGEHLVQARYACVACHGRDFAGGEMVDDAAMGRILGPNLTRGAGGKITDYSVADWDRIVRHGIKPDGTAGLMPSGDFTRMSDQELSDIIVYIQTRPPVDQQVPAVSLGPLAKLLMALGELPLSADEITDHHTAHPVRAPKAAPDAVFGEHLIGVCITCHRPNLQGGPIPVGPPDWPAASNLTPGAGGLAGWTYDQFVQALREGVRPDGQRLREPMWQMRDYARNMTEVELQALWVYLQGLPALPTGT